MAARRHGDSRARRGDDADLPDAAGLASRVHSQDSGARVVIASNATQAQKILDVADTAPALSAVVTMDAEKTSGVFYGKRKKHPTFFGSLSWADLADCGHRQIMAGWGVGRAFRDRAAAVRPGDLATIIYTSGTTGVPKGVELTHANLVANLRDICEVLTLGHEDVALSFLPLCHAFERMVAYVYLANGVSVVFAESFDTIARDLRRVRPTFMTGVPRVFEKLLERIDEHGEVRAAGQARSSGTRCGSRARSGGRAARAARASDGAAGRRSLADRLVFERVREGLGGRLRTIVSGSAPLCREVAERFLGMGLPILEGYGLTETSPVLTLNHPGRLRVGTVGPALPGVELRIAEDGEILARGPNIMRGYLHRAEDTAAALGGGWFHTGDIGAIDADGYLRITDRKKDLIVTSGGKKIAPQPIEDAFRRSPLVAEATIVGDGPEVSFGAAVAAHGRVCPAPVGAGTRDRRRAASAPSRPEASRGLFKPWSTPSTRRWRSSSRSRNSRCCRVRSRSSRAS